MNRGLRKVSGFVTGMLLLPFVLSQTQNPVLSFINNGDTEVSQLIDLGTVDNKTYFLSRTLRNWDDSRLFCHSRGMQLATITSQAEVNFLKSVYDPINFFGWYWVGAKRSVVSRDFNWVQTGSSVKLYWNLRLSNSEFMEDDENCLAYSSNGHEKMAYYFRRACHHGHFGLCEIFHYKRGASSTTTDGKSDTTSQPPSTLSWVLMFVGCAAIFTCLVIFVVLYASRKFRRQYILTEADRAEFFEGANNDATSLLNNDSQEPFLGKKYEASKYEIPKHEFLFGNANAQSILGQGNYGFVHKLKVTRFDADVAVKVPRDGSSRQTIKSLLSEIKIMSYVGDHENVVRFLGAYTKEIKTGAIYIATELCPMGSLQSYLYQMATTAKENLDSATQKLFRFCMEVAHGMKHISEKGVIHGDLSARNVLLDVNGTCKITDFGLSRKMYQYQVYIKQQQEELSWRWLAIETLKRFEFSTKSDVWSYGVTVWEIFSFGDLPYPGITWTLDFVERLASGTRLLKPGIASDATYLKMLDCWNIDQDLRPTFEELETFFRHLRRETKSK